MAVCSALTMQAGVTPISSDKAPKAVGPYSQAVRGGDYVYVSGQLGFDPATGNLVGNTVETQTRQILNNIEEILKAAGLTLNDVVKVEVFLSDLKDFKVMNEIYAEKFTGVKPARTTVQVGVPKGGLVEIACTAYAGD